MKLRRPDESSASSHRVDVSWNGLSESAVGRPLAGEAVAGAERGDSFEAMAEPVQTAFSRTRFECPGDPEEAPLDLADFPGCRAESISREEMGDYDGRVEYWEARTETAVIVREPTTRFHEQPSQRLARLAERIAASRGSPIETFGTTDLVRYDSGGERKVLMQADQILYLHPLEYDVWERDVDIDSRERPEIVLEVDYSTDVRRRKLWIYEAWGFPEVWVDVPDARSPSRPKSRVSGLTIHVLHDGRFREASSSRAFPGWTAEEIHRALNEPSTSEETLTVLRRVGRALGAAEGMGPDDDPWLRSERAEGREEGRAEGLAEGRAEMLKAVVGILEARGIAASPGLTGRLAMLDDLRADELIQAARTCSIESEFLALLTAKPPQSD